MFLSVIAATALIENGAMTIPARSIAMSKEMSRICVTHHHACDCREEQYARMEAALIRLRDCDFVITPADRMDAVRNIAREALKP